MAEIFCFDAEKQGCLAKTRRPGIRTDYGGRTDTVHAGFGWSGWVTDGKKWAGDGWGNPYFAGQVSKKVGRRRKYFRTAQHL